MVTRGAVVADLTSLSEDKFGVLQAQARLHLGKDICTQTIIDTVKDTNTITDIKFFMQKILGIHPNHSRIDNCCGDLLPDGVQISEMNAGVEVSSGFTLNLNCFFVTSYKDQMNIFFDAVFVSSYAIGLLSLPWGYAIDNPKRRLTKVESQTPAKRRRISTKGQLNLYPRCA